MKPIQYEIKGRNGLSLQLTNLGARVVAFNVPDRTGQLRNVTLGFEKLAPYVEKKDPYFGCIVGRVANRIKDAEFELGGKRYTLPKNHGKHCLHGGVSGLSYVTWEGEKLGDNAVRFKYLSPDREEGFPGKLATSVTYTLDDEGLLLEMEAVPDRQTPVNLTNHMYFNLESPGTSPIFDHQLQIFSNSYVEVDPELIPTGKLLPLTNGPFDFREARSIGDALDKLPAGIDHTLSIKDWDGVTLRPACKLVSDKAGIALTILTTQPGLQVYTGNFLDGSLKCQGQPIVKNGGIALEPHHFPDTLHQPDFPSILFDQKNPYRQTIRYKTDRLG